MDEFYKSMYILTLVVNAFQFGALLLISYRLHKSTIPHVLTDMHEHTVRKDKEFRELLKKYTNASL